MATKNVMNPNNFVVWCDVTLTDTNMFDYGYKYSNKSEEYLVFVADEKRAAIVAKQMAGRFPGCNVYISQATKVLTSKVGPINTLAIKPNGEVLPE